LISFKRSERIAGMIRKEIADILLKEISDPRIGDITITDVILSGDLRQATVFFVQMGKDRDSGDVHDHLQKASGLLKRELGRRLRLRYVPEIRLVYDGSFEYGSRIDRILETMKREKGHET